MTSQQRRLLPNLPPAESTDASSNGLIDGARHRSQISAACNPCRTRKLRCSGDRPTCYNCSRKRRSCVYDVGPNLSRLAGLKRRHDDYEEENRGLHELIDHLRHRPYRIGDAILRGLRTGKDVETLLRNVQFADPVVQTRFAELSTFVGSVHPSQPVNEAWLTAHFPALYHMFEPTTPKTCAATRDGRMQLSNILAQGTAVTSLAEQDPLLAEEHQLPSAWIAIVRKTRPFSLLQPHPVVDERLNRFDPQQWISFKIDRVVMSNLISSYLSWHHKCFRFFDEQLFLEDLVAGRTQFCSPMLLSAICCTACMYFLSVDPYAQMYCGLFFREANRLWLSEISTSSVTAVSSAAIYNLLTLFFGNDKIGMSLLHQGIYAAKSLLVNHIGTRPKDLENVAQAKRLRAEAVATWGIFTLCANYGLYTSHGPIFAQRPTFPPPLDEIGSGLECCPEPFTGRPSKSGSQSRQEAYCHLCEILNDYCSYKQYRFVHENIPHDDTPALQSALNLFQQFAIWSENLPQHLRLDEDSFPDVIDMHMTLHATLIDLLRPFITQANYLKAMYITSIKQLRSAMTQLWYRWHALPQFLISSGMVHRSAYNTLTSIGDDPAEEEFFMLCLYILVELRRVAPLQRNILHSLLLSARSRLKTLPLKAQQILDQLERDTTC